MGATGWYVKPQLNSITLHLSYMGQSGRCRLSFVRLACSSNGTHNFCCAVSVLRGIIPFTVVFIVLRHSCCASQCRCCANPLKRLPKVAGQGTNVATKRRRLSIQRRVTGCTILTYCERCKPASITPMLLYVGLAEQSNQWLPIDDHNLFSFNGYAPVTRTTSCTKEKCCRYSPQLV